MINLEIYFARSANDSGRKETVAQHLDCCRKLCAAFLEPAGLASAGDLLGSTHDFGKLSARFQQVLEGQRTHINHALPGGVLAQLLCLKYTQGPARKASANLLAAIVASHHCHLKSYADIADMIDKCSKGVGDGLDPENYTYSLFGPQEFSSAIKLWFGLVRPKRPAPIPSFQDSEDASLSKMLFARLLYSALVDADWTSSALHFESDYLTQRTGPSLDPEAALERLFALRREKQLGSSASPALNRLRDQLFDCCLEAGAQPPGLFTLTAPTGLGKTLCLMAFALRHASIHQKRRIVLVLPYLSILEQNCKDYRRVIPNLLEIHSQVSWREETRHLAERWDAPCIVTTNVSFLQPLFSARAADCRHLHQLANSVIVFDEAQTLPGHLLEATLRTLKELCSRYRCTVVLSTATQPSFQFRPGLSWVPQEIAPAPAALFAATRRVQWSWRVSQPLPFSQLADELAGREQSCTILNLKRHARTLYRALAERCPAGSLFYLTTDLCPAHRTRMLEQVRSRLSHGLSCRLVATQCVEAGVDLDFPAVYRALAPLDSLIQAAGRCNRNGDSPTGQMIVFLPEEEGRLYPTTDYQQATLCVRTLLSRHAIDCSDQSHVQEYYQLLYGLSGGDRPALRQAIQSEDYSETERQYQIIPRAGVQILVPYSGATELFASLRDRLDREGVSPALLRQAQEITVLSYDRKGAEQHCQQLWTYSKETGRREPTDFWLLGDPRDYSDELGLLFDVPFDGIL